MLWPNFPLNRTRGKAPRAYYELVSLRLDALREGALPNLQALNGFLTRRLTPATQTCTSTEARQENLSRKLARAAQLLRTRVDIELHSKNKELLSKMNNRLQLQLKLQQAVKGVSIAAIAFYLLSILRLHFERLHRKTDAIDPVVATALARGKLVPDS